MVSNYPPGVQESDIPGSRPEDAAWEKLIEDFCSSLPEEVKGFIVEKVPWTPTALSLFEKAIQFGIDIGKKRELENFTEKRFYQEEYFEDRLTSIMRLLYWRMPSSINTYSVVIEGRKTERWEIIAYFGIGGGQAQTSGVHPTLPKAVEKLFERVKKLTSGDEEKNQALLKKEKTK